jgi:hypothetical protein
MAFYRDEDGAVWLTGHVTAGDVLHCVFDPADVDDVPSVGLAVAGTRVRSSYGPLVEIRPTGWEIV